MILWLEEISDQFTQILQRLICQLENGIKFPE